MNKEREPNLNNKETFPNVCVCCGAPVPEGRMICWDCEHGNKTDELETFRPKREKDKQ